MSGKQVLVSGLGRMGLRHLRGVLMAGDIPTLVSRSSTSISSAFSLVNEIAPSLQVASYANLEEIPDRSSFDAAILATTTDVRPAQLNQVLKLGVPAILLEKPLAQSRVELDGILVAAKHADISVCHFRRTLPLFQNFKTERQNPSSPLVINVVSGASGIGCNGVHWIDLALFLSGEQSGRLLWGEISPEPIKSGRGEQFEDVGGCGVFALGDNGSRLVLTQVASSSAPTTLSVVDEHRLLVVDQLTGEAYDAQRSPTSVKPHYLYGQDYERTVIPAVDAVDWPVLTSSWLDSLTGDAVCHLPKLDEAAVAHRLLFDLLETSGATNFAIT